MTAKRSSFRRFLRICLTTVTVIGFCCSLYLNLRLSQLRKTHMELRKQVGLLDVKEADKVTVMHVTPTKDLVPPGIEQAYVWQYRVYIPGNYGPCYSSKRGLISADSPRGNGGSSSSWTGAKPEPKEELFTMALVKDDGKWLFSRSAGGGSSSSQMPNEFSIDSLDDYVIEQVVQDGETRVFDTDEAICLFRFRERELATKRNGEKEQDLYRGFSVYLFSQLHQDAFNAWAKGESDSMKENLE